MMLIDLLVRFSWAPEVKELWNQNIGCGLYMASGFSTGVRCSKERIFWQSLMV